MSFMSLEELGDQMVISLTFNLGDQNIYSNVIADCFYDDSKPSVSFEQVEQVYHLITNKHFQPVSIDEINFSFIWKNNIAGLLNLRPFNFIHKYCQQTFCPGHAK